MTDKSFTFFEIHLHDGFSFSATNTAPAIGRSSEEKSDAAEEDAAEASGVLSGSSSLGNEEGGRAKGAVGALLVLALFIGIAAAARSLRGGGESGEFAELDDFVEQ